MKRQTCVLTAAILFALAPLSAAQAQIVTYVGGGTNRTDGPYTVGNRFTVGGSPITINALGLQDLGAAGIAANTPIGIWTDTNVLLRTANVLSGSANNTLSSGYQYVFIAPLTLTSGTTYRIAAVVGGAFESFQDANLSAVYAGNGGSIVADVYNAGGTLTFPNSDGGGNDARWAPANAALLTAGTRTWNGGSGSDNNFTSNANWGGSDLKAGDNLVFAGSTRTSPNNNILANTGFSSITFNGGAAAFTLGGNAINLLGDVTNNSSNLQTINTALVLDGATRTFNTASGNMTVGAAISTANGANGLTKTGAGILTLNAVNTYTGLTTVSQGTLTLGVGGSISTASPLNIAIASGATLNLSGAANNQLSSTNYTGTWTIDGTLANTTNFAHSIYTSAISMTGGTMTSSGGNGGQAATYGAFFSFNNTTITANGTGNVISGNGDFGINGGTTLFLATPLAGDTLNVSTRLKNVTSAASLTKSGLGTVTLSGANTYTGATTVNGGTLEIGGAGVLGGGNYGGAITLANNASLTYASSTSQTYTGTISGAGTLTIAAGSTFNLNGANNQLNRTAGTGNLVVNGTLSVINGSAHTIDGGGITLNGGTMTSTTGATGGNTIYGSYYVGTDRTITANGTGNLISGPGFTLGIGLVGLRTLTLNTPTSGDALTVSTGIFNANSGTGAVTKTGSGTVTLSGANTYSGATSINNGTLLVDGTHTGGGLYTVANGATLGGTGSTTAAVTVSSAGKLAPGSSLSPGDLGTGDLLLSGNSIFEVNLDGVLAGTQYDQVDVTGSVNVTNSLLDIFLGFTPSVGGMFTIIDNNGTDPVIGTFSGLPEGSIFYDANQRWLISYAGGTGNDVVLTALPEPSTLVSGLVGLFALTLFAWRERRRVCAHGQMQNQAHAGS